VAQLETVDRGPARRRRRVDLAIGILVGLVLGFAIVTAFLLLGSEGALDAPRVSGVSAGRASP
jgi:hypothetical protein